MLNAWKPEAEKLVPDVVAACAAAGVALIVEPAVRRTSAQTASLDTMMRDADALLVLGGDGTILRAVSCMGERKLPVLGINIGTLGFLAETAPEHIHEAVIRLSAGDYRLQERMLLEAWVEGENTIHTALNDVVVTRGSFTRLLDADTYVDDMLAARYAADGSIIASPTGSTAYSLSVGGPIVAPGLNCLVLAPICPHTLSSRPIVVSAQSRVRIVFRPRGEDGGMLLSVDGIQRDILREQTVLGIRRSDQTLPFVRFDKDRFFELLRGKLSKWGGEMQAEQEYERVRFE